MGVAAWLIAATLLLAAAGCSMATFGYGALPTYAMWQLDSWLALDDDQRVVARHRIDELQRWHRAEQLPQYARLLDEVDGRVRTGLSTADLAAWRTRALDTWAPLARQAAPAVAELLGSLKPAQVERLRDKMADANRKWLRENAAGDAKGLAARQKRYLERAEFFLGDLTREQTLALRQEVTALPLVHETLLAEREARQQRMLALIGRLQGERPPPETARRWCEAWLLSLWESPDPGRRTRLDQSLRAADALSVSLWAKASEAQRRHLSAKLRDFAEQATLLASAR